MKIDNARERRERGGAWKEDKSIVRKSLMKKSLEMQTENPQRKILNVDFIHLLLLQLSKYWTFL